MPQGPVKLFDDPARWAVIDNTTNIIDRIYVFPDIPDGDLADSEYVVDLKNYSFVTDTNYRYMKDSAQFVHL